MWGQEPRFKFQESVALVGIQSDASSLGLGVLDKNIFISVHHIFSRAIPDEDAILGIKTSNYLHQDWTKTFSLVCTTYLAELYLYRQFGIGGRRSLNIYIHTHILASLHVLHTCIHLNLRFTHFLINIIHLELLIKPEVS